MPTSTVGGRRHLGVVRCRMRRAAWHNMSWMRWHPDSFDGGHMLIYLQSITRRPLCTCVGRLPPPWCTCPTSSGATRTGWRGSLVLCRVYHIPLPTLIIRSCTTTTTSRLIGCTRGSHLLIFGIRAWSVPSHLLHLCMARVALPHTCHGSTGSHVESSLTPYTGHSRRVPSREHSSRHRNW